MGPGQIGTLLQGAGHWSEVRCERVCDDHVLFSVTPGKGEGRLTQVSEATFQTIAEGGVLRIDGQVLAIDGSDLYFGIKFIPKDQPLERINRREYFRIDVTMRGKLHSTTEVEDKEKRKEWDCVVRDLSVGGAKVLLRSPGPAPRSTVMLMLTLPPENHQLLLECKVVQTQTVRNPPPFDNLSRLAFTSVKGRMESILFRFVNWAQLELLKKGVR